MRGEMMEAKNLLGEIMRQIGVRVRHLLSFLEKEEVF
jgi:hypothetical protein